MKRTIILLLCVLLLASIAYYLYITVYTTTAPVNINKALKKEEPENVTAKTLLSKAITAKQFVKKNKYNEQVCFLIDMKIRSGAERFFVYDLKADTVITSGVVTHGGVMNVGWLVANMEMNRVVVVPH